MKDICKAVALGLIGEIWRTFCLLMTKFLKHRKSNSSLFSINYPSLGYRFLLAELSSFDSDSSIPYNPCHERPGDQSLR